MTQPIIEGAEAGIPRMIYGSDGTDWIAVLVDALGHIQADILSSALPTGAATDEVLQAVRDRIGALTSPAAGSTNKLLTDALTALQLIDDLRAALGSVATDKILVASKSGDKIFGFESIVEEATFNLTLAAGTNTVAGTPVGTGKVWRVTRAMVRYVGTVPTSVRITVPGLATGICLLEQLSPVSGFRYTWGGEVYLQADDYMAAVVEGATLNDDLYLFYAGVQMNAP